MINGLSSIIAILLVTGAIALLAWLVGGGAVKMLPEVLKSDHPWVRSYFHGARAQMLHLGA